MVVYIHGPVKADTSIYDQTARPDAYTQMPHMLCLNSNRWRVGLPLQRSCFLLYAANGTDLLEISLEFSSLEHELV